ncbi:MAG: rhodanese-like domain-containing protein, partial [Rhizobacter sp.]
MPSLSIDAPTFRRWLDDGGELAVLDLRSVELFAKGEPLYATNLPADRLLADFSRFVPRAVVRTVLVHDDAAVSERLAQQLRDKGHAGVVSLQGGLVAWAAEAANGALPTFDTSGLRFSVGVRDERGTPKVTAAELQVRRANGADVVVLDTRTAEEFARGHVPGAWSAPGAELLLRFRSLVPSPTTEVLVSCAGLPRAILGAQTLIDAKVANPVSYLDHGTRGWTDIGGELETGTGPQAPRHSATARESAAASVERLGDAPWPQIDYATARAWLRDDARTTYLLDVRTAAEFAQGSLPEAVSAPGGQLLAVSHRTLAVRGARVILLD